MTCPIPSESVNPCCSVNKSIWRCGDATVTQCMLSADVPVSGCVESPMLTMYTWTLCTESNGNGASVRRTLAVAPTDWGLPSRSEEHTSELQSRLHLVCRLLLEKKKTNTDVKTISHRTTTYMQ